MSKPINTSISRNLYLQIVEQKKRMVRLEQRKVKSRRRIITMAIASDALARRLR